LGVGPNIGEHKEVENRLFLTSLGAQVTLWLWPNQTPAGSSGYRNELHNCARQNEQLSK